MFACNLPFTTVSCPKLAYYRNLARTVPLSYKHPDRNKISGVLLNTLYDTYMAKSWKTLRDNAVLFGVSCFGDGATIKTVPCVNMMASGVHNPACVLDIADCTAHVATGGLKDASYLAQLFLPLIEQLEGGENGKWKGIVDLLFFDGASNVQNAGRIIMARYPRITLGHGAEHVCALFFSDVYNGIRPFKRLCNFSRILRNVFGSTRHKTKAMFDLCSRKHNNGRVLGFVKPSECRMGGEEIALLRVLRLRPALQECVSSREFLALNEFQEVAYVILLDSVWEHIFVFCRAMYAPMRLLRLADMKTPCMSKLYYYVMQTEIMLQKYVKQAEDAEELSSRVKDLFKERGHPEYDTSSDSDDDEVNGDGVPESGDEEADDEDADDEDADDADDVNDVVSEDEGSDDSEGLMNCFDLNQWDENTMTHAVMRYWLKRKDKFLHDYCLAGYLLSPNPTIMEHAKEHKTREHTQAVNRLISKLILGSNLVGSARNTEKAKMISEFWNQHDDFERHAGMYDQDYMWINAINEPAHKWHQRYSSPDGADATVFGQLACLVVSKILGIGSAERNWKEYKLIKSGNRHRLGSLKNKKAAVIYGVNCEERARVRRAALSSAGRLWEDKDFEGCKMNAFCQPIIDELIKKKSGQKNAPRVFRAWRERWEMRNDVPPGGDVIFESQLVAKYGGLKWNDPDKGGKLTTSHPEQMRFVKARGNNHYDIHAVTKKYDFSKNPCDQMDEWEPWEFIPGLYNEISDYYNKHKDENVTVYAKDDDCESDEERDIPAHLMYEASASDDE